MSSELSPVDVKAVEAARARQLQLTKPPGSLGRLEDLACWFAGRLGKPVPDAPCCEVFVFAADHGVAERGVSAFPQSVTAQMVANFARGGAAINVLASLHDCHIEVVDVGVSSSDPTPANVRKERVRAGTRDLASTAAMTPEETRAALAVGERCARAAIERGARLLIAGDMGIANTTAAACLICAFTGETPEAVVGRGTGVDDAGLVRKREVVQMALARLASAVSSAGSSAGRISDPLRILGELGGLEIAAIAGFYLESAREGVPVMLDGYISTAAALAAAAIEPGVVEWMLASHRSAEAGHRFALQKLKLEPLLDLGLRLGEGTGAALALPIVRAALALHARMATFAEAGVSESINEAK
jgi:nicotinate-nucleotide--dimethylbenzimidazole phosphoribosyltransferase